MPPSNRQSEDLPAKPAGLRAQWPTMLVTLLIGTTAVCLAWPQIFPGPDQANEATLPNLNKRVPMLRQADYPIRRDSLCVGLSAYGRSLDRALPKDARIFFSGMIGKDNGSRGGYYFFLRNYLFPREVEVSLDGKAVYLEGWFEGIPCDSPAVLQTNGFDLLLKFQPNNNIDIIPLTAKGVPK